MRAVQLASQEEIWEQAYRSLEKLELSVVRGMGLEVKMAERAEDLPKSSTNGRPTKLTTTP